MTAPFSVAVSVPARSLYVSSSRRRVRIYLWDYSDKFEGTRPAAMARRAGDLLDACCVALSRKAAR